MDDKGLYVNFLNKIYKSLVTFGVHFRPLNCTNVNRICTFIR